MTIGVILKDQKVAIWAHRWGATERVGGGLPLGQRRLTGRVPDDFER